MESLGMLLLLLCGCVISVRTGFVQLRRPFSALDTLKPAQGGGVSPYEAFATSLGACIGTGNIAGVAGAMLLGGPGTLVWMWLSALLCSASKYVEIRLALRHGGTPMDYMERGLPRILTFLSPLYALVCMLACLTMGNLVQVNAVAEAACVAAPAYDVRLPVAAAFTILIALVAFGGAKRVGRAAAYLVPVMSALYALGTLILLVANASALPRAIAQILAGAFAPRAVTGGAVGFFTVLRVGVSRGVFTHEAGLGTAALAHGATRAQNPHKQALLGVFEVFIDTIVLCTLTALAILVSGVPLSYGSDATNGSLVIAAFSVIFGRRISALFIAISLFLFAFTSIQSFSLYGAICANRLLGRKAEFPFRLLFCLLLPLGAYLDTSLAWRVAELSNALMAIVNAAALLLLTRKSKKFAT